MSVNNLTVQFHCQTDRQVQVYSDCTTDTLFFPCSMVDRFNEKRRDSSLKSTLKDCKKREHDEGDFSKVLTNESSTPIVRNQQLNASSIMQSPFHLGQKPCGNDSVFQDYSLVESVFCTPSKVHHCLSYLNKVQWNFHVF